MESLRFRHSESNRDTEEILRDDRGATSMYEEIHEEARWWIEHSMLFIPLDDFGCRRHDIFFCSLFTTWVVSCTDINKMGRLYKNPGWSWLEECTRADNGKGYKAKQNTSVLFKILLKYWLEENTRLSALEQNQTLPIICQWFCSSPKWYGPRAAAYDWEQRHICDYFHSRGTASFPFTPSGRSSWGLFMSSSCKVYQPEMQKNLYEQVQMSTLVSRHINLIYSHTFSCTLFWSCSWKIHFTSVLG